MDEVQEALDDCSAAYLDLIDQYSNGSLELESRLKKAFFSLSKSKLILGAHRVGPNSYDFTPRSPMKTIVIENACFDSESGRLCPKSSTREPFSLCVDRQEVPANSSLPESQQCPPSSSSTVELKSGINMRKRTPYAQPELSQSTLASDLDSPIGNQTPKAPIVDDQSLKQRPDPIHQFAALPPPSLRLAQTEFSNALEVLVHLANLRANLMNLEKIIMTHKQALKSS
ncbi:hypothetical protein O181_021951 [Austropuccinia psidii MF-1]|uniref:Vacuolar ATPase assembly protein VMA22 n=1 Tax=Austropuccinia psidii MF-1 TaxID=1389203 RepID=A0A9Q3CBY0_9BASI|nr:hypothetical protein [Austropuccinia psidii MF-1]